MGAAQLKDRNWIQRHVCGLVLQLVLACIAGDLAWAGQGGEAAQACAQGEGADPLEVSSP